MSSVYIELAFEITPREPGAEILIAELGAVGFESFVETETGVLAYIQRGDWKDQLLEEVDILSSPEFSINYAKRLIAQQNWNEEWERNFSPILVGNDCVVRAPFHPPYEVSYEIVIEPKMSFGTGHHETTFMMLQWLLETECTDLSVLDMGCGTAVLAIMAEFRGAASVLGIDIDEWSVENSKENIQRNHCSKIEVRLGDAAVLPKKPTFDLIIANINRNILLQDMENYVRCMKPGGTLLLSGFYREDLSILKEKCTNLGLQYVGNKEKNHWIAAKFVLSNYEDA